MSQKDTRAGHLVGLVRQLGQPLLVLDTETTGTTNQSILEIAWMRVQEQGVQDSHTQVLDPLERINPYASRVHGYKAKDVRGKPTFDAIYPLLQGHAADAILCGYGVRQSDVNFIRKNCLRMSLEPIRFASVLDVRDLWRRLSGSSSGKLGEVALHYGVEPQQAHRALGDVQTTVELLDSMVARHGLETMVKHARTLMQGYRTRLQADMELDAAMRVREETQQRVTHAIHEAIFDHIETFGRLLPEHYEQVAKACGRYPANVSYQLSDLYARGQVQREQVWCEQSQEFLEQHLEEALQDCGSAHRLKTIKAWLVARQKMNPTCDAFFVSERRTPLNRRTAWHAIKGYGEKAALPLDAHPHMLRHACGYELANQGADTRLIQDYLGHRNIQHTVQYTATNPARFEKLWR